MKIQLLPSTFDERGRATQEQRLTCLLVDDRVAVDAGSIALAVNDAQRDGVRDIIITHAHIDHVATLPILIDDLFASLAEPVRVHSTPDIIERLERDIFNWSVYPRFAELNNGKTFVMEYVPFRAGEEFQVAHLRVEAVPVTHTVPTVGLIFTDGSATVAVTSDTTSTEEFWRAANRRAKIDALIVETSFPNEMAQLALTSGHLTPSMLEAELEKFAHKEAQIFVVHLKAAYRERLLNELGLLAIKRLCAMESGRVYTW